MAETISYDLSDFDSIAASEGIHMLVTTGVTFEVIAESNDPEQLACYS